MSNEKRTKFNLNPRIKSVKRGKSSKHILAEVGQLIAIQSTLNKTVIQKGGKRFFEKQACERAKTIKSTFFDFIYITLSHASVEPRKKKDYHFFK